MKRGVNRRSSNFGPHSMRSTMDVVNSTMKQQQELNEVLKTATEGLKSIKISPPEKRKTEQGRKKPMTSRRASSPQRIYPWRAQTVPAHAKKMISREKGLTLTPLAELASFQQQFTPPSSSLSLLKPNVIPKTSPRTTALKLNGRAETTGAGWNQRPPSAFTRGARPFDNSSLKQKFLSGYISKIDEERGGHDFQSFFDLHLTLEEQRRADALKAAIARKREAETKAKRKLHNELFAMFGGRPIRLVKPLDGSVDSLESLSNLRRPRSPLMGQARVLVAKPTLALAKPALAVPKPLANLEKYVEPPILESLLVATKTRDAQTSPRLPTNPAAEPQEKSLEKAELDDLATSVIDSAAASYARPVISPYTSTGRRNLYDRRWRAELKSSVRHRPPTPGPRGPARIRTIAQVKKSLAIPTIFAPATPRGTSKDTATTMAMDTHATDSSTNLDDDAPTPLAKRVVSVPRLFKKKSRRGKKKNRKSSSPDTSDASTSVDFDSDFGDSEPEEFEPVHHIKEKSDKSASPSPRMVKSDKSASPSPRMVKSDKSASPSPRVVNISAAPSPRKLPAPFPVMAATPDAHIYPARPIKSALATKSRSDKPKHVHWDLSVQDCTTDSNDSDQAPNDVKLCLIHKSKGNLQLVKDFSSFN